MAATKLCYEYLMTATKRCYESDESYKAQSFQDLVLNSNHGWYQKFFSALFLKSKSEVINLTAPEATKAVRLPGTEATFKYHLTKMVQVITRIIF